MLYINFSTKHTIPMREICLARAFQMRNPFWCPQLHRSPRIGKKNWCKIGKEVPLKTAYDILRNETKRNKFLRGYSLKKYHFKKIVCSFNFIISSDIYSISKLCHVIKVINDYWKENNDLFRSVLYISFSLGCYTLQSYTKPSLIGFNMDLLECVYAIKTKFQPPGTAGVLSLFVQWARFAFGYFAKRTNNFS